MYISSGVTVVPACRPLKPRKGTETPLPEIVIASVRPSCRPLKPRKGTETVVLALYIVQVAQACRPLKPRKGTETEVKRNLVPVHTFGLQTPKTPEGD